MREIILHEEATVANRAYFNYDSGLTKDNILGVLNKTTGKAVYTPLKFTSMTMLQSLPLEDGTRNYTLQFTNLPPIAVGDKLLIKIYVDTGDSSDLIASFFNITEATEYTALTPAEAIAIARDCQYNVMGTDWPIPTWLPTGVTEAQVESAAEALGIPYHEPTQTA